MKPASKFTLIRYRSFIFVMLLIASCLLAPRLRQAVQLAIQPSHVEAAALHGEPAIEQLKKDGSYSSLAAAMNAARYQIQSGAHQQGHTWLAENPAQQLSAHFTPDQLRIEDAQAHKAPWRFGMKLKGYGYGDELAPVSEGQITSQGNRVEIRKSQVSNLKSEITEWYVNKPEGIEQGFILHSAPSQTTNPKSQTSLRLKLQLTGDLRAEARADNQSAILKDAQDRTVLSYDHLAAWDAQHKALSATLHVEGRTITLEVNDAGAVYPVTIDPLIAQQAKFTAADGAAGDKFGSSVAVSGDYAIVGAPEDDAQRGSAYVFVRSGSSWSQQAKLIAVDGIAADRFGISVSISGPTALIGASGADFEGNVSHGAAYVFVRSGSSWSQQAKLAVSDGSQVSSFGYSVAVSGDTALIGTPSYGLGGETARGAAYVYTRAGVSWSLQQKLLANDGATGDGFGNSVSLDGDTALLGALTSNIGAASDQGAAYVFTRSGALWSQQAKLVSNDGAANDQFGWSVGLSADTAVIGSRLSDVGGHSNEGAAYVFARSGASWSLQQKLVAADGGDGDAFGLSVAVSGDLIAVGSDDYDLVGYQNQGSIYLFARNGGAWSQQQKLRAADGAEYDHLGKAVAISGNTIVSGAPQADVNGSTDQGAAYAFIVVNDVAQTQKFFASDGKLNAEFGNSVAIDGDTAVVGAHFDTVGAIFPGSVYVFIRNGATWTLQQKLTPGDGVSNDEFGFRVAVSGDTLVAGAPFKANGAASQQGAAYVYVRNGSVWSQQQKLLANDGAANDRFGQAVAINGDALMVGAPADQIGANGNQGSVYAFTRSGANWTQQQKLTASDGAGGDYFGNAIAMSGYAAIIGAPFDTINGAASRGSAYVFNNNGGATWTQQQKLTASDGAANHSFGYAVALDGPTALVGAYGNGGGAAYVFAYNGSTWNQQQELFPSDPAAGNLFGLAVSLSGELASIGASNYDTAQNQDQGAAYLFERQGNTWTQRQKLLASDAAAGDKFGQAIAMTGSEILVGAPSDDIAQNNQGSVYYFRYSACSTIILNATPPNGTVGTSYNQQLSATGGVGPYQYALSSGTLPPGLSLTQSGLLSGTPMTPGTFNFTITAMTASLCSGSQAYTVTIAPNCQLITISPATLPTGTVGIGGYNQPLSATGGVAPYTYSLNPGDALPLGLSLVNGAIVGGPQQGGTFNFTIKATDAQGCVGTRTYTLTANCQVLNVFPASLPAMTVGAPFNQGLSASGSDGPYTYSLGGGALPGGLTLSSGGLISGIPTNSGNVSFTVNAADVYGCITPKQYNFSVGCSTLTVSPASLPDGATGTAYNQQLSTTGGVAPYSYSLPIGTLPPLGLSLSSSGALTGTPQQAGSFNFAVNVSSGGCTGQKLYTLTITQTCGALVINPPTLPNGTVGTAYNQQITATGGTAPYNYNLSGGQMPTGMSVLSSGLLSGTPSQSGNFNFTITATDANNCARQQSYALTVNIGCPTINITPALLPTVFLNVPYSQQLMATGGAAPYTFSIVSSSLPAPGLNITPAGLLTGTISIGAGGFGLTVKAIDANGCSQTLGYSVTVMGCPTINVSPTPPSPAFVGVPYQHTFIATGGTAPYTYSIAQGPIPDGLTLSTAGVLSGTPTGNNGGGFAFTVKATDASGCMGQVQFGLTIGSCPVITVNPANATLPAGQAGTQYSQTFTQTGGAGTATFAVTAGALPNGLSLATGGALTGSPIAFGDFNFTVTATDANACTGARIYSLHINAPCATITVNPASLPDGTVGTVYNQTATATGGTAPYTFTISAGALPGGLNLASGGALTGTPNASGVFNFTVKATDANGCLGTRAYTVTIAGVVANNGLQFYPLPRPVRILDTRAGQGNCDNVSSPITGGTSLSTFARLTCEGITIPANAQAVVGNVTVLNKTAQTGYMTIYPDGQNAPLAANMIYGPNGILANNFTVGLSANGNFNIFGERTIDAVVDISGYYAPPAAGGLYYHPLAKPIRLLDTRAGQGNCDNVNAPIAAGTSITTLARVTCEGLTIPQAAQAVVGVATVINGSGQTGYLTIYPNGVQAPLAANLIYFPGQVLSNAFTVSLSASGEFNIFGERQIDMVMDVAGYYSTEANDVNGTGLLFTPMATPVRLLDTRAGQGNCDSVNAPIAAGTSMTKLARMTCEGQLIPNNAQAIIGNVTVINLTAQAGYLTLYPTGQAAPLVANMIYQPNQILSNAFVVGLNGTGQFNLFAERTLEAIVDVSGFFVP